MAKKKAEVRKVVEAPAQEATMKHARIELPSDDMERVRKVAKSIGLNISAFIRQAVYKEVVEVEKRMGGKP